MTTSRKLTAEQKSRAAAMHASGTSRRKIANEFGVSRDQVDLAIGEAAGLPCAMGCGRVASRGSYCRGCYTRKMRGLPGPAGTTAGRNKALQKQIAEKLAEGVSVRQIAETFGGLDRRG